MYRGIEVYKTMDERKNIIFKNIIFLRTKLHALLVLLAMSELYSVMEN